MNKFSAIFQKGGINAKNLVATTTDIQLDEGTINYYTIETETAVTASEYNSQICMAGPAVTLTSANANCIANTDTARKGVIATTVPDKGKLCTVVAKVCNGTCTGTVTSTVNLQVLDGSIQF